MLIAAYAKGGDAARADGVLRLMADARIAPTLVTYNTIASAHAARGDLCGAERAVKRAVRAGLQPDRYTYGALLQAPRCCGVAAVAVVAAVVVVVVGLVVVVVGRGAPYCSRLVLMYIFFY